MRRRQSASYVFIADPGETDVLQFRSKSEEKNAGFPQPHAVLRLTGKEPPGCPVLLPSMTGFYG
jgi:hypothetical protein